VVAGFPVAGARGAEQRGALFAVYGGWVAVEVLCVLLVPRWPGRAPPTAAAAAAAARGSVRRFRGTRAAIPVGS
jgi:hypothetical protein